MHAPSSLRPLAKHAASRQASKPGVARVDFPVRIDVTPPPDARHIPRRRYVQRFTVDDSEGSDEGSGRRCHTTYSGLRGRRCCSFDPSRSRGVMTEDDTSASTLGTLVTMGESSRLPILPALTILAHPDVNRVGETAPLTQLFDRRPAKVDRDEPLFFPPGSDKGRGLEHRGVSKKSTSIVIAPLPDSPARFELRPGDTTHPVELDLKPFGEPRLVTQEDLGAGLVITINKRVVLCLHHVHYPVSRSRDLGLLGASDEIEDVRRKILRAAAHPNTPVLIRGETGVGKEPTARAIHAESTRAARPFVVLNMARLSGRARGRGSLRACARSIHRCEGQPRRRLPPGRWRNTAPRRDRRDIARGPDQALASPRGERGRSRGG